MRFTLLISIIASTIATTNSLLENIRLRGAERDLSHEEEVTAYRTKLSKITWASDGFQSLVTPAPSPWNGDTWEGISTGGWGKNGWEGSWGGFGTPVKVVKGGKESISEFTKSKSKAISVTVGSSKSGKSDFQGGDGSKSKSKGSGSSTPDKPASLSPSTWLGDAYPTSNRPTPSPLVGIITPVPSPSPTACEERMIWHPKKGYTMCTNDADYEIGPMAEMFLHDSLEICCRATFGTPSCEYEDICTAPSPTSSPLVKIVTSTPSSSPSACNERRWWHANPEFQFCTNDSSYPAGWVKLENFEQYFYETLSECCTAIFDTVTCDFVDVCLIATPAPTSSPLTKIITPAPSVFPTTCEERQWYALHKDMEEATCSNGFDQLVGSVMYDSREECCLAEFDDTESCHFEDVCNDAPLFTPLPTRSPSTLLPTFGSTPTVSKETTGPPTVEIGREFIDVAAIMAPDELVRGVFRSEVSTSCHKVHGGNPVVCVYVCTEITSIYESDNLIREESETSESECP